MQETLTPNDQDPQNDDIELKVASSGNAISTTLAHATESQWGCFQYTLITLSLLLPILMIAVFYISLLMINKTTKQISLSGTIGTAGSVKILNVLYFIPSAFLMAWVTLIRNVQIRVIFDRFNQYNITSTEDSNTKELTDYVCSCCHHCRSDTCGGPIYHNKRKQGNCVRGFKYYCTTLRGFNFLMTIGNILGWISLAAVAVFDVYKFTLLHLIFTATTAGFVFFYQFTHAVVLCCQRQREYELLEARGKEKNCKNMCYFLDVLWSFLIPSLSIITYFSFLFVGSYLSLVLQGNKTIGTVGATESVNYTLEWVGFTLMVVDYLIFPFLFLQDNVQDELVEYSLFTKRCCFC
eukprot:60067_1